MCDFKPGDGAKLKYSSYPVIMTVKKVDGEQVTCIWHDDKMKEHEAVYPCATLEKLD